MDILMITQALLDAISNAAIAIEDNNVHLFNQRALHYFPDLTSGYPAPNVLQVIADSDGDTGTMTIGGAFFTFSRVCTDGSLLLFLNSEPSEPIQDWQLGGIISTIRSQISEGLISLEPLSLKLDDATAVHLEPLRKMLYRMNRLVSNMNFLHDDTPAVNLITMDFVGLCHEICRDLSVLISDMNIQLSFNCENSSLLIYGDPILLKRMLLGLISNSARSSIGGFIHLTLSVRRQSVTLVFTDSGLIDPHRPLSSILAGKGREPFPDIGEGAGLGLPVIRRILSIHGGTILLQRSELGGLQTTISLPINHNTLSLSLFAPDINQDTELSPLLTELSDILPSHAFNRNDLQE